MVSDQGNGRFKLRLPLVQAPAGARERALDQSSWAYRLTAVELAREGKVRPDGEREPLMGRLLGKRIADMRRYVTIEFEHPGNGARLGFRLQLAGHSDWLLSTGGRFYRSIKRSGTVRTTIELPAGTSMSQIARLQPITQYGKPSPGPVPVVRAFGFDERYQPVPLPTRLGPW
jgi:hypothetical protein